MKLKKNLTSKEGWQVAVRDNFDFFSINRDDITPHRLDSSIKGSKDGIILEEVRGLFHTTSVIDGNHIKRSRGDSLRLCQHLKKFPFQSFQTRLWQPSVLLLLQPSCILHFNHLLRLIITTFAGIVNVFPLRSRG